MDDNVFISELKMNYLLPGSAKDHICALRTPKDKSEYLLSHVIHPCITTFGDVTYFNNLLKVMEESGYIHVKKLAQQIKSRLNHAPYVQPDLTKGKSYC